MRAEMDKLKQRLEEKQVNSARRSEVLIAVKNCGVAPRDVGLEVIISVSMATDGERSLQLHPQGAFELSEESTVDREY
jgi:hypothetical protein